jgi:hypothetical protein
VVSFMPLAPSPLSYPLYRRMNGLVATEKQKIACLCLQLNLDLSVSQSVAQLLYGPTVYPSSFL